MISKFNNLNLYKKLQLGNNKITVNNINGNRMNLQEDIYMKISWLKYKEDNTSFRFFKNIGMEVFEIDDLEKTDTKLAELVKNDYKTIIISNEVAGFSEDIIKKYAKNNDVNIIIAPNKYNDISQ